MKITTLEQVSQQTIDEIIDMAKQLEQSINALLKDHIDHAGRIDEAMTSIANVIDNLEGHQKDIEAGME